MKLSDVLANGTTEEKLERLEHYVWQWKDSIRAMDEAVNTPHFEARKQESAVALRRMQMVKDSILADIGVLRRSESFLKRLAECGGCIVSSASCTQGEILTNSIMGVTWHQIGSLGFVHRIAHDMTVTAKGDNDEQ